MTFQVWLQTVGAVFAGCLLFGAFAWGFIAMRRDEARGGTGWSLSTGMYLSMAATMFFLVGVIYSLG